MHETKAKPCDRHLAIKSQASDYLLHVLRTDARYSYKLHALKGDMKGMYSVWVTGNWRIVYRFVDEPEDVDFTDYH